VRTKSLRKKKEGARRGHIQTEKKKYDEAKGKGCGGGGVPREMGVVSRTKGERMFTRREKGKSQYALSTNIHSR